MWHGKYITIFRLVFHWCFRGFSQVFGVCFKVILWVFTKGFKCMCIMFLGCFRMFFVKKRFTLHKEAMAATHANSNEKKDPKNTPGTPVTYSRITLKHPWNNHKVPLKHPWNRLKTPMNHQITNNVIINMYFPCHNDGHLEENCSSSIIQLHILCF